MVLSESTGVLDGVVAGLKRIGYGQHLIAAPYDFPDWYSHGEVTRLDAAAFARTPWDYDSACLGVVCNNAHSGNAIINRCRALGAPFVLEINPARVTEWAVSRNEDEHQPIAKYNANAIDQLFAARASIWKPEELLREKNLGEFKLIQAGLFDGLVPDLEEHIQRKLDPLLINTLSATTKAYESSSKITSYDSTELFRLVFWLLTAKVFHDRNVPDYRSIGPNADACIEAISRHYSRPNPPCLLNREAREVAVNSIWFSLDFRNLSVEVLTQLWSSTLLDQRTKEKLGVHRTPRSIVKYLVDLVPFKHLVTEKLKILEPCCGTAAFLITAMKKLRQQLVLSSYSGNFHHYVRRAISGIEQDPFSSEISLLALTLADFPNPNKWDIVREHVFDGEGIAHRSARAGVVLCNPPFGQFDIDDHERYSPRSHRKPAELLHRLLDNLHPSGVLGFVLPRSFVDSIGYADVRRRLADRFETLDVTVLPDKAFPSANSEIALLVAKNPIPHRVCQIVNKRVRDDNEAWLQFQLMRKVSSRDVQSITSDEARKSVMVPEFQEIWEFMLDFQKLSEVADVHRGIEWDKPLTTNGVETGYRSQLVRKSDFPHSHIGIAPRTPLNVFEVPEMHYLDINAENMKGLAYRRPWNRPKAILNKSTKSRGHWRIAAFPDTIGVICYQTYTAIWPTSDYDEWILTAILNSPVANVFVSTREGKRDTHVRTLRQIPVPNLTTSQSEEVRSKAREYQRSVALGDEDRGRRLLIEIDSLVLDGYRIPARMERKLLEFVRGHERATPFKFPPYFNRDFDMYFNLSDYLSDDFRFAAVGQLLQRMSS